MNELSQCGGGGGAGEKEWSLRPLSGKEGERRREGGKNEKKRREAPFFDLSPSLVSLSPLTREKNFEVEILRSQ